MIVTLALFYHHCSVLLCFISSQELKLIIVTVKESVQYLPWSLKLDLSVFHVSQETKLMISVYGCPQFSMSHFFQEKSKNTSLVKHLFCTVWLMSGCVAVEEVVGNLSFYARSTFTVISGLRGGVNMITDVLYSLNTYIRFCACKALWVKSCYIYCAIEVLCIIITIILIKTCVLVFLLWIWH